MRLIDADALLEHVWRDRLDSRERIANLVKFMPTIKPERKTGKWKRRLVDGGFNADWHCSKCGWKTSLEEHGYNFCPHCGSYNRGEE